MNDLFGSPIFKMPDDFPEGTDFYHWTYDDGTENGVAIDILSDDVILSRTFATRKERKEEQRRIKTKNQNKHFVFRKNGLPINTGVKNVVIPHDLQFKTLQKQELQSGGNAFLKLLSSCGQDFRARQEVLKLVSGILSGYTFKFYIRKNAPKSNAPISVIRAPILVSPKKASEDFLAAVSHSLIVDTAPIDFKRSDKFYLVFTQPDVLPARIEHKRTIDSAHTKICGYPDRYPAQYRESAVYLRAQFFRQRDLLDFQRRNCWATIVMSGASDAVQLMSPIMLDYKILANYALEENWDEETVHDLATLFVIWFRKYRKICDSKIEKREFQRYSEAIAQSNRQHGTEKIRGLKALWLQVQLRTMGLFAQFAKEKGIWSEADCDYFAAQWENMLLPGICPQPEPVSPLAIDQAVIIPEADGEHLFQNVLSKMLAEDNWQLFCRVAASGLFPRFKDGKQILGYVRMYRDNKAHRCFPALQIRERDFCQEAKTFSDVKCDWFEVVKGLREAAPIYLHPSKTCRMPDEGESGSPCPALILRIDQLNFLPENAKDFLLNLALLN